MRDKEQIVNGQPSPEVGNGELKANVCRKVMSSVHYAHLR